MHDDLGDHAKEEELDEANGEAEASPVMAVLHDLEAVTLEVDFAVKVHLVEGLHGDLVVAAVLEAVRLLLEVEVELDRATRQTDLLGLAGADGGNDQPPDGEEGKVNNESEEDGGLEATTDLPAHVPGHNGEDGDQDIVVEGVGTRAVGGKRSILDGGELKKGVRIVLNKAIGVDIESMRVQLTSSQAWSSSSTLPKGQQTSWNGAKTHPGSGNTAVLELIKVGLGVGGSFDKLKVCACNVGGLCHGVDRSQWLTRTS